MGRNGGNLGRFGESRGKHWVHEVWGVLGEKGSFLPGFPHFSPNVPKIHQKVP